MRRVRYSVAMSLDGYLAGPNGEIDWITNDPEVGFVSLPAQFDTMVMGRKTYEFARAQGASVRMPGIDPYWFNPTDSSFMITSRVDAPPNSESGLLRHERVA